MSFEQAQRKIEKRKIISCNFWRGVFVLNGKWRLSGELIDFLTIQFERAAFLKIKKKGKNDPFYFNSK